ncbi:MAG: YbhB/YbcL family Raf kinase inhibitor-like protein [Methanomassiliicoccus sp.]|nr:YbhB/YbcL family Raf kinase inhibitor-like protein [Methanomassiliicoccus sp.]
MGSKDLGVELGFRTYPDRYTCKGEGVSPPITITGSTSPYLAIILDDPDAPSGTFIHWVMWNIPSTDKVPENISAGASPPEVPGAVHGSNTDRELGYVPPCPPRGHTHRYYLKVYGLGEKLALRPGSTSSELEKAMVGKVLQYGEAMATFRRD